MYFSFNVNGSSLKKLLTVFFSKSRQKLSILKSLKIGEVTFLEMMVTGSFLYVVGHFV